MMIHPLFHITHEQIQLLKIVLQTGSLARAATVLGLQPSTLSKSLRRMEDKFGISLLTRHGKGVQATRAGSMLLEKATWISNQSKVAAEMIQELKEEGDAAPPLEAMGNALLVTIGTEISDFLLGAVFAGLKNRPAPEVSIDVYAGSRIEECIIDGSADIGIVCDSPTRQELDSTRIADEAMVIVFGPSLLQAAGTLNPRLHALAGVPMLLPSWEHSARRFIEQNAMRAGIRLNVQAELGDFAALKTLLKRGLGYSILPECAVRDETARGQLCVLPLQGLGARIAVSMIHRPAARDRADIIAGKRDLLACLEQTVACGRGGSMRLIAQPVPA